MTNLLNVMIVNEDLVLGSKIREGLNVEKFNVKSARTLEKLKTEVEALSADFNVIINLNNEKQSPFEVIQYVQGSPFCKKIIAFYSHVNTELAQQAKSLGVSDIMPRSKFFSAEDMSKFLLA